MWPPISPELSREPAAIGHQQFTLREEEPLIAEGPAEK